MHLEIRFLLNLESCPEVCSIDESMKTSCKTKGVLTEILVEVYIHLPRLRSRPQPLHKGKKQNYMLHKISIFIIFMANLCL